MFALNGDAPPESLKDEKKAHFSQQRIGELDGFRAIAVLWVLLLHLCYGWPPTPPKALSWMPSVLVEVVSHGWLGVDLFFILSGFLITGILIDTRGTADYFRNFYARRARRILPLYLTCILLMGLAYHGFAGFFGLSFLFLANFAHLFHARIPHGPDVLWSLAVEEHFYLLWPLLVRFLTRSVLFVLALVVVFGSPILRGYCFYRGMDPVREIYVYTFFRLDGLALGAILAMWVRSRFYNCGSAWKLAGFLIGFSLLVTVAGLPFGIMQAKTLCSTALRYTQAQFLFAAMTVLALAFRGSPYTAILRSRFAARVAGLSYCIYLIHLALGDGDYRMLRALHFSDVARFGIDGAVIIRFLAIGGLTFGLAVFSKKFLEDPFLRFEPSVAPIPSGRLSRLLLFHPRLVRPTLQETSEANAIEKANRAV
jgi:peptidoglycan/LPS O-acetylase OafA/YrhL